MSNQLYSPFKEGLLNKIFDLNTDSIRAALIDLADYAFSAAHDEFADVPTGARVAQSGALGSPTIAAGVFDTADFTWSTVTGDVSEAVILWDDTPGNKPLIAFYDTSITGMPLTPNGGNVNCVVNASGWLEI